MSMPYKSLRGRIENYFPPVHPRDLSEPYPTTTSLLCDLPLNVLRLILAHSGLFTRKDRLDLNLRHDSYYLRPSDRHNYIKHFGKFGQSEPCFYRSWTHEHEDHVAYEGPDPDGPKVYPSLVDRLMMTRSLCQAARDVLYGDNSFEIRRSGPGGFMPLLRLSATDISSLTSLVVHLDVPYAIPGCVCTCDHCYPKCWSNPLARSPYVPGRDLCTFKILSDWAQLCARLESDVHPGKLKLTLNCEVAFSSRYIDFDLVESVLAPLHKLPQLAQCSIRLTRHKNQRLKDLAQETVNKLTGKVVPSFPFNRLPADLRYEVLRQTDLIAPFPLVWTGYVPSMIYRSWRKHGYVEPEWRNVPRSYPHNKRRRPGSDLVHFGPLWKTTPDPDTSYSASDDGPAWEEVPDCAQCDIEKGTGFTSQCKLWHFPAELFRVNREVSELAKRIFFMHNRFMLLSFSKSIDNVPSVLLGRLPYNTCFPGPPRQAIRMPRPIKPKIWHYIHNLEIVFRVTGTGHDKHPGFTAMRNWEAFVRSLQYGGEVGQFNLRRLNLSVVVGFHKDSEPSPTELGWRDDTWRVLCSPLDSIKNVAHLNVTVFETFRMLLPWELGLSEEDRAFRLEQEIDAIWHKGTHGLLHSLFMEGRQMAGSLKQNICPKKWWWLQHGPEDYPGPELKAHVVFRYIDNPRKNCQWLPCEVSDDSEILSMQKWWGKLK